MSESTFQRAFAGGELAPSLSARADTVKYVTGLRTCRNFVVQRHGGVANRAGLRFVGRTRDDSPATVIFPFMAAVAGDSVLLEAGPFYVRVYKNGGLVRLTGVADFDAGAVYFVGAITTTGGANFYCVADNMGENPVGGPSWYEIPDDILELPIPFGNAGFAWQQSGNVITLTAQGVPPHELIYVALTEWIVRPVDTGSHTGPPRPPCTPSTTPTGPR